MPSIIGKKDDGMMFLCLGAMLFNMLFGELCGRSQRNQSFSSDLSHGLCGIVILKSFLFFLGARVGK